MEPRALRISPTAAIDLGNVIEVRVGLTSPTAFHIHEGLVRGSSEFFDKAMRRDWKEAAERVIHLPEDDPEAFRIYMHWLYFRTLPCRIEEPGLAGNAEYLQLAKAYVLGDKILAKDFADATIDAIVDKANSKASDGRSWFPVGEVVRYLYAHTLPSSPARRLLVDFYVTHGNKDWVTEWADPERLSQEFLLDLAVGFYERLHIVSPLRAEPCAYHQHEKGSSYCYRQRSKKAEKGDGKTVNGV